MARFGALLALFGFGSAVLYFTGYQFTLMMWAQPMQPGLGLGVGGAGALLLLIPLLRNKDGQEQQAMPAGGPPPGAYGPPSGPQPMPMHQAVPPQGPQFGPRPPQGPPPQGGPYGPPPPQGLPPQYGPGQGPAPYGPPGGFGPQGGPPYGPRG